MSKITFSPIPQANISLLSSLSGGTVFCFHETDLNIVEVVNAGNVYMVTKDSHKEGTTKVVNLSNGLIISRDSDRKVVRLSSEFRISIIGTEEAAG